MPRRDWNNNASHSQKPRHKRMHSAAKGRGHDRKMKTVKRDGSDPRPLRALTRRDRKVDVSAQDVVRYE